MPPPGRARSTRTSEPSGAAASGTSGRSFVSKRLIWSLRRSRRGNGSLFAASLESFGLHRQVLLGGGARQSADQAAERPRERDERLCARSAPGGLDVMARRQPDSGAGVDPDETAPLLELGHAPDRA